MECRGVRARSEIVTVTAGETVPDSTPQTLGAGGYSYQATYNGNANYTSKTGGCEPFTVRQATPATTTIVKHNGHNAVTNTTPAPFVSPTRVPATPSANTARF